MSESTTPSVRCQSCHTGLRFIDWARNPGYHFRCRSCDATETIKVRCPKCAGKASIMKRGKDFSIQCDSCPLTVPYFSNFMD